ncbi:MAG: putative metal-dependent hydrolase [Gemmatimonadota bacterium]|jgi:hypothetical protein
MPDNASDLETLRYPIGRFEPAGRIPATERVAFLDSIASTPARLRAATAGLSAAQLDTPYRNGGWTVRQLIHHVPDSHLNAYVRFKLALTEDNPRIKPYEEAEWAKLQDSWTTPVETSLTLLDTLHDRWDRMLRAMSDADFQRTLDHPEMGTLSLDTMTRLYEWHGRHHVAHVMRLRERMGW